MTKVKFYKELGGVLAVFPNDKATFNGYRNDNIVCYSHVGQHSECHKDYLKGKKLATYEEYKDLLSELISIGYDDLAVMNKEGNNRSASLKLILLSVILGSIFMASCNTYKSMGCGQYSSWESHTKYRNPR